MLKRWILRTLYAAFAAIIVWQMVLFPAFSTEPTLYEAEVLPLSRGITPAARQVLADTETPLSVSVTEPEEEKPAEDAVPGDIFGLMYHNLTTDESETTDWTTTPEKLREDLETLLSYGYRPLSIEDYLTGNYEIGPDYFVVTFDDGYESNLTLAEPLLREMGIPAVMFLITANTELPGHLTWDQVKELQDGGVITVYSHTHTHADGKSMSTEAFLADVAQSWEEILAHLDEPEYKILSYPNGSYTRATMRALAADGFALFTIQNEPWWFEAVTDDGADEDGIRILVRLNVGYTDDISYLVALNRRRTGQCKIEDRVEQLRQEAEAALAAERAERSAWLAFARAEREE